MSDSQRNIIIVMAVAIAAVAFSSVGGVAIGSASALINLLFTIAIIWFLGTLYTRHSGTIATMPATPRTVLRVAAAVLALVLLTGSFGFLPPPFGWAAGNSLLYFGSIFACGFAIWWAWQQRTSKW